MSGVVHTQLGFPRILLKGDFNCIYYSVICQKIEITPIFKEKNDVYLQKIKDKTMAKVVKHASNEDYKKFEVRGVIKEIMRNRGLRSINVANYNRWYHKTKKNVGWLHSIKLNLMDGYLYLYGFNDNPKVKTAGNRLENVTMDMYDYAYDQVKNIITHENTIPSYIKRNILVKMCR